MKSLLITGGLGYVGGRLAHKLSSTFNVIVSSRSMASAEDLRKSGGISLLNHLQLHTRENFPKNVDTVIHLAALNEWDCVKYPSEAIKVNVDEARLILENSIANGVENFVYFSTAHVYGSPLTGNVSEDSIPHPVHPYAITHKAAEDYVLAAASQSRIKAVVIRLSNSIGAPILPSVNRWTLLVNDLCKQAVSAKELTLSSNGCQHRDFVCLTDVENVIAEMVTRGLQSAKYSLYNLGSGVSMTVMEMAKMIAGLNESVFGIRKPIRLPANAVVSNEPTLQFDIKRILQEGYVLRNDFSAEVEKLLRFCDQHFGDRG